MTPPTPAQLAAATKWWDENSHRFINQDEWWDIEEVLAWYLIEAPVRGEGEPHGDS